MKSFHEQKPFGVNPEKVTGWPSTPLEVGNAAWLVQRGCYGEWFSTCGK